MNMDPLRVHAVQDVLEAPPFFADAVRLGNLEIIEEGLVRIDGLASHFLYLGDSDAVAVEARVEK
jgi:hypothetical protein